MNRDIAKRPWHPDSVDGVAATHCRAMSLCTCTALHSPPRDVVMPRSFKTAAICLKDVAPSPVPPWTGRGLNGFRRAGALGNVTP